MWSVGAVSGTLNLLWYVVTLISDEHLKELIEGIDRTVIERDLTHPGLV